jgi:phosphoribosylanthranilate isomerase
MHLFVKICGITSPADAHMALDCGADALGLNFYAPSPRCVTVARASEIANAIGTRALKVGVFVNATPEEIAAIDAAVGLDLIQLHGDEPAALCARWPGRVIKACRLQTAQNVDCLAAYAGVRMLLLDAAVGGAYGGTGMRADWHVARMAKHYGVPLLLAGGLTPENVADAVRVVEPFGVDTASGVESAPGRKDAAKVRAFIAAARAAGDAIG